VSIDALVDLQARVAGDVIIGEVDSPQDAHEVLAWLDVADETNS
jgi:hypothetical protein